MMHLTRHMLKEVDLRIGDRFTLGGIGPGMCQTCSPRVMLPSVLTSPSSSSGEGRDKQSSEAHADGTRDTSTHRQRRGGARPLEERECLRPTWVVVVVVLWRFGSLRLGSAPGGLTSCAKHTYNGKACASHLPNPTSTGGCHREGTGLSGTVAALAVRTNLSRAASRELYAQEGAGSPRGAGGAHARCGLFFVV